MVSGHRDCLSGTACGSVISKKEGRASLLQQSCPGQRQGWLGDLLRIMLPSWAGVTSSPSQWKLLLLLFFFWYSAHTHPERGCHHPHSPAVPAGVGRCLITWDFPPLSSYKEFHLSNFGNWQKPGREVCLNLTLTEKNLLCRLCRWQESILLLTIQNQETTSRASSI